MAVQTNLNVSLTRQLLQSVRSRVKSGLYQSASEVVREGLRLLDERDREREAFWAETRTKVAQGKAELLAGKGIGKEAFREKMDEYVQNVKAGGKKRKASAKGRKA